MSFDPKILITFVFILAGFFINFIVKKRISKVLLLIIYYLIFLLFLSLVATNYQSLKELTLALIVYLMVLIFLITNFDLFANFQNAATTFDKKFTEFPIDIQKVVRHDSRLVSISQRDKRQKFWLYYSTVFLIMSAVFFTLFFIVKNLPNIVQKVSAQKLERQNEEAFGSIISPLHSVHSEVRKLYLGKKIIKTNEDWTDQEQIKSKLSDRKKAHLKAKLANNFLLKRSSDFILIVAIFVFASLIFNNVSRQKNN